MGGQLGRYLASRLKGCQELAMTPMSRGAHRFTTSLHDEIPRVQLGLARCFKQIGAVPGISNMMGGQQNVGAFDRRHKCRVIQQFLP